MTVEQLLFSCIRAEVRGEEIVCEQPSPELLHKLYALSKSQDLAHIVAEALDANGLLGADEISAKLQKQQMLAIYRYQRINDALHSLCDALEDAQIPFVPLKGSVLREYYPKPWTRTSSDIDVLVHEEDLERACEAICARLECKNEGRSTHDISLMSAGGVHIELHYSLVEEGRAAGAAEILSGIWDYTELDAERAFQRRMRDEAFYFYHVAHMAKHFERGGCGVRPFVDLWLLDHIEAFDTKARKELLRRGGLLCFAEKASLLSRVWLEGLNGDATTEQLAQYILRSGVFGNTENKVAMGQVQKGGRLRYVLGRIFPSLSAMCSLYPILKKHAWLLPICHLRRWGRFLFRGDAKRSMGELRASGAVSADAAKSAAMLLKNLEL